MSKVRVLAGTRKGAFILSSDGKREKWDVSGPHFAGWEIYHMKGSPVDPNRLYVSQTSGWFGQIIQRSDDGGKTWHQPGTPKGEAPAPGEMPKGDSNDNNMLERFVTAVQKVAPQANGPAIQIYEAGGAVSKAFRVLGVDDSAILRDVDTPADLVG